MHNPSARIEGLLPETQYDIDVREAPRFGCPLRSQLRVIIRPSFLPVTVTVNDVSAKGIGLLCEAHIELGACLAIFWKFGGAQRWRTVRARVVRLAPRRDGGWVAGCVFQDPLQNADLEALLRSPLDAEPVSAETADAVC
jgi:PilZ domain